MFFHQCLKRLEQCNLGRALQVPAELSLGGIWLRPAWQGWVFEQPVLAERLQWEGCHHRGQPARWRSPKARCVTKVPLVWHTRQWSFRHKGVSWLWKQTSLLQCPPQNTGECLCQDKVASPEAPRARLAAPGNSQKMTYLGPMLGRKLRGLGLWKSKDDVVVVCFGLANEMCKRHFRVKNKNVLGNCRPQDCQVRCRGKKWESREKNKNSLETVKTRR